MEYPVTDLHVVEHVTQSKSLKAQRWSELVWRKALLTSSCFRIQFLVVATTRRRQRVVSLATSIKVSKKSSPSSWVNPLATTLALWRSTVPSEWYLILYTHLQPIVFFPGRRGVSWICLFDITIGPHSKIKKNSEIKTQSLFSVLRALRYWEM